MQYWTARTSMDCLGQSEWENSTTLHQTRFNVVCNVLSVLYPGHSHDLWNKVKSSPIMNTLPGASQLSQSQVNYLEVLSEAYKNVSSWDSRRQILSIMTGVATFKEIQGFILGLTQYRFTTPPPTVWSCYSSTSKSCNTPAHRKKTTSWLLLQARTSYKICPLVRRT